MLSYSRFLLGCLLVWSALCGVAQATIHVVDVDGGGDHLQIQAGLTAAAGGDTVEVWGGIYQGQGNKDLDFAGKPVVLRGRTLGLVIIDLEGIGRAFLFDDEETGASSVEKIAIINASTTSPVSIVGGASPTFYQCVVEDNDSGAESGGAVSITDSSPAFENCYFLGNTNSGHAGGVHVSGGGPSFIGCTIAGNTTSGQGGGFWLDSTDTVRIDRCTFSGNSADLSATGYQGGALTLTGSALAVMTRSIVWSNRADLWDEIYVETGSYLSIDCSDVEVAAVGGVVDWGSDNIDADPQFCLPACCGEFDLMEAGGVSGTSPCHPDSNSCGEWMGIGLGPCNNIVAWTGDAGTRYWSYAGNWSSGERPGPGDHVQMNRGSVVLDIETEICLFTQCPREAGLDTFFIVEGGHLILGVDDGGKDLEIASVVSSSNDNESGTISCPLYCFAPYGLIFTRTAVSKWSGANIRGGFGPFNQGRMTFTGPDTTYFEVELLNQGNGLHNGTELGIFVEGGTLAVADSLVNEGRIRVQPVAEIALTGTLINSDGAVLELAGDLTGSGTVSNSGLFDRIGPGVSLVESPVDNLRDSGLGTCGTLRVSGGTLELDGAVTNQGQTDVLVGTTLQVDDSFSNSSGGRVDLIGDVAGTGRVDNLGLVNRTGPGTSEFEPRLNNLFDSGAGQFGQIQLTGGSLDVERLDNAGYVRAGSGTVYTATDTLLNRHQGSLAGTGTFDLTAAEVYLAGAVRPGSPIGSLSILGDYGAQPSGRLVVEIGGLAAGADYDRVDVDGEMFYGGSLQVRLTGGFVPVVDDSFTILTFDPPMPPVWTGFDCTAGLRITQDLYLEPVIRPGRLVLVTRTGGSGNAPPVAHPDIVSTSWDAPLTITPLRNDDDVDDPEEDALSLVYLVQTATQGAAFIDEGDTTITYIPPVLFIGTDSLVYAVTDCNGNIDTTTVTIEVDASPVPEPGGLPRVLKLHPNFPNPFNPVTRFRFDLPEAGRVSLTVFDLRGRRVRTLVEGRYPPGGFVVDWYGRNDQGRSVSSGVYLVRLVSGHETDVRKITLVR
jgi:Bacterial Ig domain/Right handed beta helix region